MKLISLTIFIISSTVNAANEHFPYPPHFQNQNSGIFSTESSLYLPPESHTPMPYFSIKDFNNLPFPYLPPSSNKGHSMFPTPFPLMITTTLVHPDDSEDDEDKNSNQKEENKPAMIQQMRRNMNQTERVASLQNRKLRPVPNNINFPQQIDRKDMKPFPFAPNNLPNTMKNTVSQTASPRSLIISPDNSKADQVKAGSFYSPQYLPSTELFFSSTVEPAIPILRLSNEMDLDGSFSYEALGADQTHYVQQSRMENLGTDKEEQVVEGSYSYVGDNGQTYTVHYIADSNGFRATGEHLPVAPPIPEIIQRSIQYNLAEEARKPHQERDSWEYGIDENEFSESAKRHSFTFAPPQKLFTGKTPESFSHSFSQASNKQNNLVATASSNTVKTVDFRPDQMKTKINSETISPQITFVASQGAHVPSVNKAQQQSQQQVQQTIAKMFTLDKPAMPQLINYEAVIKDAEQENNKALWRWQYGLHSDNNQSQNKNTISRSSGDDVIINFHDMTPEQYSNMIKTEIQHDVSEQQANSNDRTPINENKEDKVAQYSTTSPGTPVQYENWNKKTLNFNENQYNLKKSNTVKSSNAQQIRSDGRAKLITLNEFLPPSQTVTQSYDYADNYEARSTKAVHDHNINLNVIPLIKTDRPRKENWSHVNNIESSPKPQVTQQQPLMSNPHSGAKFTDFIVKEDDKEFKPMISTTTKTEEQTTTEANFEDSLKENIFLKNIFNNNIKERSNISVIKETQESSFQPKQNAEIKSDKSFKYFAMQGRPFEQHQGLKRQPIADIADVLNFMSSKTSSESSKIRPRNNGYNYNQKVPEFDQHGDLDKTETSYDSWNHKQREELKGLIKNYKVLQRNNNGFNSQENINHLRMISPPPPGNMQSSKLPPLGRAGPSIKSYLPPIYV